MSMMQKFGALPGISGPRNVGVPAQQPTASSGLPDWAHHQVMLGGGNPSDYIVHQGQLMKKLSPEQEKGLSDNVHSEAAPAQAPAPQAGGYQPLKPISNFPGAPIGVQAMNDHIGRSLRQQFDESRQRAIDEPETVDVTGEGNYVANTARPALGHMLSVAGAIDQHAAHNAALASNDPNHKLNMLRQISADPQLRNFYLASRGAEAETIGMMPNIAGPGEPAINDSNFHQQFQVNPTLGAALSTEGEAGNMGLLERLQHVQNQQGIADPNHPNHQALQSWINQRYADPNRWAEETFVPPQPPQTWLQAAWQRPLGMWGAASRSLFGNHDEPSLGTGYGWQRNYKERTEQADLLKRLGIQNPADIPRQIVGQRTGQ